MTRLGHYRARGMLRNGGSPAEVHQDGWDWAVSCTKGLRVFALFNMEGRRQRASNCCLQVPWG